MCQDDKLGLLCSTLGLKWMGSSAQRKKANSTPEVKVVILKGELRTATTEEIGPHTHPGPAVSLGRPWDLMVRCGRP